MVNIEDELGGPLLLKMANALDDLVVPPWNHHMSLSLGMFQVGKDGGSNIWMNIQDHTWQMQERHKHNTQIHSYTYVQFDRCFYLLTNAKITIYFHTCGDIKTWAHLPYLRLCRVSVHCQLWFAWQQLWSLFPGDCHVPQRMLPNNLRALTHGATTYYWCLMATVEPPPTKKIICWSMTIIPGRSEIVSG